jgi:hypothetical protein
VVTAVAEPAGAPLEAEEALLDEEDDGVPVATEELDELTCLVVAVALLRASAGSWPVLSCTRIPPVVARKTAVPAPIMRRRMRRTRFRRACKVVEGMSTESPPLFAVP